MGKYELLTFGDDKQLAQTAATRWLERLAALSGKNAFLVALSGGRIARTFFTATTILGNPKKSLFDLVHFFWGDERCVPPDDPESNYRIAQELLFTPLTIPASQIHRIRGEEIPESAAKSAEQDLLKTAATNPGSIPVFDLVFLGMGEDGHVASLFPGDNPPAGKEAVYRFVRGSKPPPNRITLSYSAISAARDVWVLASGAGKEDALRDSLKPDASTPLGCVLQRRERTLILTDIRV